METLQSLYDARQRVLEQAQALKAQLSVIDNEILSRYEAPIKAVYAREDKLHGSVRLMAEDGIELKAEIDKKIKWDDAILKGIASRMNWDEASRVFKISFEVPEKIYKTLPEELRKEVDKARKTTYGDIKIVPEKKETTT
jgi:hypothetical protein